MTMGVDTSPEGPLAKPTGPQSRVRTASIERRIVAPPAVVSVSTVAILLTAADPKRTKASFHNMHATEALFIGTDATLTAANGFPLLAGAKWTDDESDGAWYGICVTGPISTRVLKVSRE